MTPSCTRLGTLSIVMLSSQCSVISSQAIYHYANPQYEGWAGTVREMFSADPEFAMGRIMTSTLDLFAVNPKKTEEPRKKLIDLSKSSQASKITDLEKLHLDAALLLTVEDYKVFYYPGLYLQSKT